MDLKYTLLLDGKPIRNDEPHKEMSYWMYKPADGSDEAKIEWDHGNFEIYVNMIKVDAEGDFLEEGDGSVYRFELPDGVAAAIVVTTSADGKDRAELKVGADASSQKVLKPMEEEMAESAGGGFAWAGDDAAGKEGSAGSGGTPEAGSGDRLGPGDEVAIGDVAAAAAAVAAAAGAGSSGVAAGGSKLGSSGAASGGAGT